MDNLTVGLILLLFGMGGTLASLGLLALAIVLLKRFFPYAKDAAAAAPPRS